MNAFQSFQQFLKRRTSGLSKRGDQKPETGSDPSQAHDDQGVDEDPPMPLVDHLTELRRRLTWSVVALLVGFIVAFAFAQEIYNFLALPLVEAWADLGLERRMIFTALHEQFFTHIKVAFFAALFFTFPIFAAQIWRFIAPGLYRSEKKAVLPLLLATPLLFFLGGAFVYVLVMPVAIEFFLALEQAAPLMDPAVTTNAGAAAGADSEGSRVPRIEMEAKVSEYLSLVMQLIFAFGLCFELPVLLLLLLRAGLVELATLKRARRYAIIIAFIVAAILTPPDPLSQIGLALPIILLYEVSIWIGSWLEKRRDDEEST